MLFYCSRKVNYVCMTKSKALSSNCHGNTHKFVFGSLFKKNLRRDEQILPYKNRLEKDKKYESEKAGSNDAGLA